ncbi:hypothetical protein [uncultured Alistipes sp.]|uniref:hypothetical protein n=1 Tax=uncultured Alistipes sp. TaxID=538949 RepID=UPI0025DCBC70|nr:hypothetical protein [uncultured Alistipes sp.]
MKHLLLFLTALCLAQQAANAQEVSVRMIDNASKSITLGERMTPQTAWNRFGIYSWKSFKDDLTDGFMELYQTGDGLYFSCLNSYVYDFNVESEDYRIIVNGKYILTIGMSFDTFRQKVRTEKVVIKELADKLYAVWFPIPSAGGYADEKMVIRVDSAHRICGIRWHVPE